ncbi:MAG: hypothetical protein ACREVT_11560, partial [Burkholderiales bacterium]
LLLVVPFVLPLGQLIPEIERVASEQLKAPVKIESLRLYFLPLPHLSIEGILVGETPFLQVHKIRVTPRFTFLFGVPISRSPERWHPLRSRRCAS